MTSVVSLAETMVSDKPRDPSDIFAHLRKKCQRCHQYYTDATNGKCSYHVGEFVEPYSVLQGAEVGWSCCRIEERVGPKSFPISLLNNQALQKTGTGCKFADSHLEDPLYTANVQHFPVDASALAKEVEQKQQQLLVPSPTPKKKGDKSDKKEADDPDYYKHIVEDGETLVGLSLKYSIHASELRRINKLSSDLQIYSKKFIYIPKTPENVHLLAPKSTKSSDNKPLLLRVFQRKTGVTSQDEARYYMDEAEYNVDKAVKQWQEDSKFQEGDKRQFGKDNKSDAPNFIGPMSVEETKTKPKKGKSLMKRLSTHF